MVGMSASGSNSARFSNLLFVRMRVSSLGRLSPSLGAIREMLLLWKKSVRSRRSKGKFSNFWISLSLKSKKIGPSTKLDF